MEEKNKLTEEEIRKLTKKEMAAVSGGAPAGNNDNFYRCSICGLIFYSKMELLLHMKKH